MGLDMGQLKKQFGKRVQSLRLSAKMTQEQLANEVGVTIESISNIERGIYGPTFDNLEKIANALKVTVNNLFLFE
jgi:transcriptional regulator with XRE-family HTH domain